jgi:hypothetical protein
MFWKKKTPTVPKQALIVDAYLAVVVPLVAQKLSSNPSARGGARVFILGAVDMLRQAESLPWEQFLATYDAILSKCGLRPPGSIEDLVNAIGQAASDDEALEKVMRQGAQSLKMYFVDRDVNAPTDLLGAVMYAEKKESSFAGLGA